MSGVILSVPGMNVQAQVESAINVVVSEPKEVRQKMHNEEGIDQ